MPDRVPRVASGLGYAGLLPFLAAASLALLWEEPTPVLASGLLLYALAIVSFLGGAWWGIALLRRRPVMLLASNVLVIAAWLGAWWLPLPFALLWLAMLLVATVAVENRHDMFLPQPPYYRRLRLRLTGVAALSLLLVSFSAGTMLSPMPTQGVSP